MYKSAIYTVATQILQIYDKLSITRSTQALGLPMFICNRLVD